MHKGGQTGGYGSTGEPPSAMMPSEPALGGDGLPADCHRSLVHNAASIGFGRPCGEMTVVPHGMKPAGPGFGPAGLARLADLSQKTFGPSFFQLVVQAVALFLVA